MATYIEKRIGPRVDPWGTPQIGELKIKEECFP